MSSSMIPPLTFLIFALVFTPNGFAALGEMTGIRHVRLRCTHPIALQDAPKHMLDGRFEKSFDWRSLSSSRTPAPIVLSLEIGRTLDPVLSANIGDLKTLGAEWAYSLRSLYTPPNPFSYAREAIPQRRRANLKGLLLKFNLFQPLKSTRNALVKHADSPDLKALLADFFVLASKSDRYEKDYAVLLANTLTSISLCVQLPPEEELHEPLALADSVPLKLGADEIRDVAFRFSMDLNEVNLGRCARDLTKEH